MNSDGTPLLAGSWMSRAASAEASASPGAAPPRPRAGSLTFTVREPGAVPRRKLTSWEAMTGARLALVCVHAVAYAACGAVSRQPSPPPSRATSPLTATWVRVVPPPPRAARSTARGSCCVLCPLRRQATARGGT